MSASITAFEAKTRFGELLDRVERGEEVVITRHNKAVAKLVPVVSSRQVVAGRQAAIAALLAFEPIRMPDTPLRTLIEAGRE